MRSQIAGAGKASTQLSQFRWLTAATAAATFALSVTARAVMDRAEIPEPKTVAGTEAASG